MSNCISCILEFFGNDDRKCACLFNIYFSLIIKCFFWKKANACFCFYLFVCLFVFSYRWTKYVTNTNGLAIKLFLLCKWRPTSLSVDLFDKMLKSACLRILAGNITGGHVTKTFLDIAIRPESNVFSSIQWRKNIHVFRTWFK